MTPDKPTIAEILRNWRGKVTQAKAAAALGMSLSSYRKIEQGLGFVYPEMLMARLKEIAPDQSSATNASAPDAE